MDKSRSVDDSVFMYFFFRV